MSVLDEWVWGKEPPVDDGWYAVRVWDSYVGMFPHVIRFTGKKPSESFVMADKINHAGPFQDRATALQWAKDHDPTYDKRLRKRALDRQAYLRNKEKRKVQIWEWQRNNPKAVAKHRQKWYSKNKERVRDYSREYLAANRPRHNELQRERKRKMRAALAIVVDIRAS